MQAQIDRNWDRTYSYFDTASREKTPRESYVNRPRSMSFRNYEIKEIAANPQGDRATVKVAIGITMMGHNFDGAPQKQTWVKENGGWFLNWSETAPQSGRGPFSSPEKQK